MGHFSRTIKGENLFLFGGDFSLPMGKQNVVPRTAGASSPLLEGPWSFGRSMSGEHLARTQSH